MFLISKSGLKDLKALKEYRISVSTTEERREESREKGEGWNKLVKWIYILWDVLSLTELDVIGSIWNNNNICIPVQITDPIATFKNTLLPHALLVWKLSQKVLAYSLPSFITNVLHMLFKQSIKDNMRVFIFNLFCRLSVIEYYLSTSIRDSSESRKMEEGHSTGRDVLRLLISWQSLNIPFLAPDPLFASWPLK